MRIAFLQEPTEIGGPGSFQMCFTKEIRRLGHEVVILSKHTSRTPDIILVIGAPLKSLPLLIRWKRKGVPIVQRLAGPYWRHRVEPMALKKRLECMLRNRVMCFVRNRLADYVVYQSEFVQRWWHAEYGPAPCPETVIVNGVDLEEFTPPIMEENEQLPILLVVEGSIPFSAPVMKVLTTLPGLVVNHGIVREIEVYGKLDPRAKELLKKCPGLKLMGVVPRERMPQIYRRRGIFLSIRLHSCPNTVLEALASGMPVVGFDTGALPELVSPEAGYIVPYGANPWLGEPPDVDGLCRAIERVVQRLEDYRRAARILAERRFSLEAMAEAYMAVFQEIITRRQR